MYIHGIDVFMHTPLTSHPSNNVPRGKLTNNVNGSHSAKACQRSIGKQVYRKRRHDYNKHYTSKPFAHSSTSQILWEELTRVIKLVRFVCIMTMTSVLRNTATGRQEKRKGGTCFHRDCCNLFRLNKRCLAACSLFIEHKEIRSVKTSLDLKKRASYSNNNRTTKTFFFFFFKWNQHNF